MTDLLERAMTTGWTLPPEAQDEIARVAPKMAIDEDSVYELTPQERASLAASRRESREGIYATDEEVRAVWAKYRV